MKNADFIMKKNMKFGFAKVIAAITILVANSFAAITAGVDYTVDEANCSAEILTANGLQNISAISFGSCVDTKHYSLAKDMDFGANATSDCETNWNGVSAMFSGEFEGNGHTISGICFNATDESNIHLFNLDGATTIQNVKFSKIYLGAKRVSSTNSFYVSLFKGNTTSEKNLTFSNIQLDNVEVNGNFGSYESYASFLVSYSLNKLTFDHISIKNAYLEGTGSKAMYVGGFVGYHYNPKYDVVISNCSLQGEIKATSTENSTYVGGLFGYVYANNTAINHDTVTADISGISQGISTANSSPQYNLFLGGIGGYRYGTNQGVEDLHFKGKIYGENNGTYAYVGGLLGHSNFNLSNVSAEAKGGYADTLITGFYKSGYLGGLISYQNTGSMNKTSYIKDASVKGQITGKGTVYIARGLVGLNFTYSVSNSYFIGGIHKSSSYDTKIMGFGEITNISNSYIIDTTGNTSLFSLESNLPKNSGLATSLTKKATYFDNGGSSHESSLPKEPGFAHDIGFAYDPTLNDGFPILPSDDQKPTYRILGVLLSDTLYDAYTDVDGKIAYKADGTPFTSKDIPAWPSNWPDAWKIDLSQTYSSDVSNLKLLSDEDYAISGCTVSLKTANALKFIGEIDVSSCDAPVFKLAADIDLEGNGTSTCKNNWNNEFANIKGTLDGDGHTISGICYQAESEYRSKLFNVNNTTTPFEAKNINFSNIYMKGKYKGSSSHSNISLFSLSGSSEIKISDINLDNISFENEQTSDSASAALLVADAKNSAITIENVTATNININAVTTPFVGGFVGIARNQVTITGSSLKGTITHSKPRKMYSYLGGLVAFICTQNNVIISNSSLNSNITSTSDTSSVYNPFRFYVGGLVGSYNNQNSSRTTGLTLDNINVKGKINAKSDYVYAGGFLGNVEGNGSTSVTASNFNGAVIVRKSKTSYSYVGSLIGYLNNNYRSSATLTISDVAAIALEGMKDTLVYGDSGSAGGLLGYNVLPTTITNSVIQGSIKGIYAGAINGYKFSYGNVLDNTYYVGSLIYSKESNKYAMGYEYYGVSGSSTPNTMKNSYLADLSGNSTSLWSGVSTVAPVYNVAAYAISATNPVSIYDGDEDLGSAAPQSPKFAWLLGYTYASSENGGFPEQATAEKPAIHRVIGVNGNDTLYLGYTNASGKIAYKEDGTAFTESDIPATWPEGWKDEWKIDLGTTYTEDFENIHILSDDDVEIDGCIASIKTSRAMQNMKSIAFPGSCSEVTYKLANDIIVSNETVSSTCTTNWNNGSAMVKGTLDGDGHKISGICINETDIEKNFIINISKATAVKNISFENIFLKTTKNGGYSIYEISLFGNSNSTVEKEISNITIDGVSITGQLTNAKAGLLLTGSKNHLTIKDVNAKNVNINITATDTVYVGGIISRTDSTGDSTSFVISNVNLEGSISATSTATGYQNLYVGGIAGMLYFTNGTAKLTKVNVKAPINASARQHYVGGIVGINTFTVRRDFTAKDVHYTGTLTTDGIQYNAVGGFIGSQTYANATYEDITVSSPEGSNGNLLNVKNFGSSKSYAYFGGFIGRTNNGSFTSNKVSVYGILNYASTIYCTVNGIIGYSGNAVKLNNTIFIGSLPKPMNTSYSVYGLGSTPSGSAVHNSYAIDKAGNAIDPNTYTSVDTIVGFGFGDNVKASVYSSNSIIATAYPKTPEFARIMQMVYDPEANEGYPRPLNDGEKPSYRIFASVGSDTLYDVYTNAEGKIAYKADGSEFTIADMPDAGKVPSGWEISLSTVYTKDIIHEQNFTVGEIDSSGCTVIINTAHALMNIGKINNLANCSTTSYKLGADLDLGGDGTSSCESNWDPTNATFSGTFDGNNKTVKGLCLKGTDEENLYMFDISDGASISSLRLTNLYISDVKTDLSKKFTVGLFKTNILDSTVATTISTLDINRATIEVSGFTDTTSVGLITGKTASNTKITSSRVQNLTINVDGSSAITVGGLVGQSLRGYKLYVGSNSVSGNITTSTNKNSNYTGGIVGYAKGMESYSSKIEGNITASAVETNQSIYTDSLIVGGIAGNVNLSTLRSSKDSVKANITINKGTKEAYIGGHFGKVTPYYSYFATPTFIGSIKVGGKRGASSYVGGLYGDIEYWYSSSYASSKEIPDAYVSSPDGYEGNLIEADNVDYIGGIAGLMRNKVSKILASTPITIDRATVLGNMSTSISSGYGKTQMGGIIATAAIHLKINNSRYVGTLSKSGSGMDGTSTGLIGTLMQYPTGQTYAVNNSYMIDLGGLTSNVVPVDSIRRVAGVGTSFTDSITLYNRADTVGKATPRSLAFASLLGFTYSSTEKLPVPVTGTQKPVYHVLGIYKGDTLYDAYTNTYGKIAYKPDGSLFTSSDLPKTWPSDWPSEWVVSTTQVFTANTEHVLNTTANVDYTIAETEDNEEVIIIKTAEGLQNLEEIYNQEGLLPLELNSDIVLSDEPLTDDCENNWNRATANLKTALNGNGHKISGICINDSEKDDSYVFDIASGASVENLTLENIYVKSTRSSSQTPADIALFSSSEKSGLVSFSNLTIQKITLENGDTRTYGTPSARYGVLFGGTNLNVEAAGITLSDVQILTSTESYAGALIGYTSGKVNLSGNKIKVNISPKGLTSKGSIGGLIGYVETAGTQITKQRGMPKYAPLSEESYMVKISGQNDVEVDIQSTNGTAFGGLIGTNKDTPVLISGNTVNVSMDNSDYVSVGGLIGESLNESGTQRVDMENNIVTGNLSTYTTPTTATTCYVGGLLGRADARGVTFTSSQDHFTGAINAGCPYLGGLVGSITTNNQAGNASFTKSTFMGSIIGESSKDAFVGGVIGYSEKQVTVNETSAKSVEGYQGTLIDFTTNSNYALVKIGGIAGYASPVTFDGASAVGELSLSSSGDLSSTTDYRYVGGLVGVSGYTTDFDIKNSFFIGALPSLTDRTRVYGIGYGNTDATVSNSYSAVVNGATSYMWNGKTDIVGITTAADVPAKIYKDGSLISEAAPNTPKFANLLKTFAYAPDANEGFPYYDALLKPTYSVSWVLGKETISQVYTNGYGKIAYNADGTPVTEADLPPLTSDKYDVFPETWELDLEKIYTADTVYTAKVPTIVKWMEGEKEIVQITINVNGVGILPNGTEINDRTVLKLPQSEKIITKDSIKYKYWTNAKNGVLLNQEQFIWEANDYANIFAEIDEPVQFFLDSVTIPKPNFYQEDRTTLVKNDNETGIIWNGENFDFSESKELPNVVYFSDYESSFVITRKWIMEILFDKMDDVPHQDVTSTAEFWAELIKLKTDMEGNITGLKANLFMPDGAIASGSVDAFSTEINYMDMDEQEVVLTVDEINVDLTIPFTASVKDQYITVPFFNKIKFNNKRKIYDNYIGEIYAGDTTLTFSNRRGQYTYSSYFIPEIVYDTTGYGKLYGTIMQANADYIDEEYGELVLEERAATNGCFDSWTVTYDKHGESTTDNLNVYNGRSYFKYANKVTSKTITLKPIFSEQVCTRTVKFAYTDDENTTNPSQESPDDLSWEFSARTINGDVKFNLKKEDDDTFVAEIPLTKTFTYNVSGTANKKKLQIASYSGTSYRGMSVDEITPDDNNTWTVVGFLGKTFLDNATIVEWVDEKDSSLYKIAMDPTGSNVYAINEDESLSTFDYDKVPSYSYRKDGVNYIFVNEKNNVWGDDNNLGGTYKATKFTNKEAFNFIVTDGSNTTDANTPTEEISNIYLENFDIGTDSLLPNLAAQFITGDKHFQISNVWNMPKSYGSYTETLNTVEQLLYMAIASYGSDVNSKSKINLYMNIGSSDYTEPTYKQTVESCVKSSGCVSKDYTTKVKTVSSAPLKFTGYVLGKPYPFSVLNNTLIPEIDSISFSAATDSMIVAQSNDKNEQVNTAIVAPNTIYRLPSASSELNLSLMIASTAESVNKVTIQEPSVKGFLFRTMASPNEYYSQVGLELPRFATLNSCSVSYEVLNEDGSVDIYADIYENADGNYVWNMGPTARDVEIRANIKEGDCAPEPYILTVDADSSDLTITHFGTKLSGTSANGVTTYQFPANGKWPVAVAAKAYKDYKINFIQFNEEDIDEDGQILIAGAENFIVVNTKYTKEEDDPEEPDNPDVEINYSINDIVILPPSGSAIRIEFNVEGVLEEIPTALLVRVYSKDTLYTEKIISQKVYNGFNTADIYPLEPGTFYAEIVLEGQGSSKVVKTDEWTIDAMFNIAKAGTWNMMSLANVTEDFKIPENSDGAIYYWDEESPVGDYMQYRKLRSVEEIQPSVGYWYINIDDTEIKRNKADIEEQEVVWDLRNQFSGWNMVANPYPFNVSLGHVASFEDPESDDVFMRWNAEIMDYDTAYTANAYEGLWAYTSEDHREVSIYPEPYFEDSCRDHERDTATPENEENNRKSLAKSINKNSWSLRLVLNGENGLSDAWNVVGVGSREINIDEPPTPMEGGVNLSIEKGNRILAKSIKRDLNEASWNLSLSAATQQKGSVKIEGLDKLSEAGLYASLVMDNKVYPLTAGEPVPVSLSTVAKTATLKISENPAVQLALGISALHFKASGNQLMVNFNLNETKAKYADIRLIDANGNVVSSARVLANAGGHSVALQKPTATGIYVLRVVVGNEGKQIRIKL